MLDTIFNHNLTLDTLNGIITHNGEFEMNEYRPSPMDNFEEFDKMVESCYVDQSNIIKIIPSTLEGCVVRVSDIIAYLGKDRLDAMKTKLSYVDPALDEEDDKFRTFNAKIRLRK